MTQHLFPIVESYDYDAYGNITVYNAEGIEINRSAFGNRYTFQGRIIDWDTGLYNFRARWYDAETGRWCSKDPLGIAGGLNQYEAFGNNPINFIDPFGLEKGKGFWKSVNKGATKGAILGGITGAAGGAIGGGLAGAAAGAALGAFLGGLGGGIDGAGSALGWW